MTSKKKNSNKIVCFCGVAMSFIDLRGVVSSERMLHTTLKKLDEFEKHQAEEIDLSENKLREVPRALKKFVNLISIRLNDNRLTSLPSWLGQVRKNGKPRKAFKVASSS